MPNTNMNFMSGIHRLFSLSLDDSCVFNTLQGLKNYITSLVLEDGSSSKPYNGQIVTVIQGYAETVGNNTVYKPRVFVILGSSVPYNLHEMIINTESIPDVTKSLELLNDPSGEDYNPLKIIRDLEVAGWVRAFNIETSEIFTRVANVNNWEISQDQTDNSLVFKYVPGKVVSGAVDLVLTDQSGNLLAVDPSNTNVRA